MKKIMIAASVSAYYKIKELDKFLKDNGFEIIYPNSYNEEIDWSKINTIEEKSKYYRFLYNESRKKVKAADALLVINIDKMKNGKLYKNYIGAATFVELFETFMQEKPIYLLNGLPDKENILYEDIESMMPIDLGGNIENILK